MQDRDRELERKISGLWVTEDVRICIGLGPLSHKDLAMEKERKRKGEKNSEIGRFSKREIYIYINSQMI